MGYFTWFHSIRGHRYLNEKRFCPISSSSHAILGFWGDFWHSWKNFINIFYFICDFYCTQNDRLDHTVSTQKTVFKTNHPGRRYSQKCFLIWYAKPNHQPIMVFLKYLSPRSFFKPIFALKPCVQDGRFEYNKRYKRS